MKPIVILLLHNTRTDLWHPAIFSHVPAPSETDEARMCRYRSRAHVTKGYGKEEADIIADRMVEERQNHPFPVCRGSINVETSWEENEVPAQTVWMVFGS